MAAQAQASKAEAREQTDGNPQTHKLKLKPPAVDGNYNTFKQWSYKLTADVGRHNSFHSRMFRLAEQVTQQATKQRLRAAASTLKEAETRIQLEDNLCRQHQGKIRLEVLRQVYNKFALRMETRSIGYETKLLKPTFDTNNCEESFSKWELDANRYEQNHTTQPVTRTGQDCHLVQLD